MRSLFRWWQMWKHDRTDANCIFWKSGDDWHGLCPPCRADGGYVARRHAEIDAGVR